MKSILFHSYAPKALSNNQFGASSSYAQKKTLRDFAFLAARMCRMPMSGITLSDEKSDCLQATFGMDVEYLVLKEKSLCHLCIENGDALVIPDTLTDPRSKDLLSVKGYPHVRFYAGIPLRIAGDIVGVLYVADSQSRPTSHIDLPSLQVLSGLVVEHLESQIRTQIYEQKFITSSNSSVDLEKLEKLDVVPSDLTAENYFEDSFNNNFDNALTMGVVEVFGQDTHFKSTDREDRWKQNERRDNSCRLLSQIGVSVDNFTQWLGDYCRTDNCSLPISKEYTLDTPAGKKYFRVTICSFDEDICQTNCTKSNIKNNTQRYTYFVEDITQDRLREEELLWKEKLLHSMTSISPLAFYAVDNSTNEIVFFNQHFCQMWGIEHLEDSMKTGILKHQDICLAYSKFKDCSPFDYCQPLPEDKCICEDEVLLPDGRIIRRFSKIISSDRGEFGRLYILEDVTLAKKNEQHLREQAALLDITTDAILLKDLSNKILLWNKSAEKLYCWEQEEALGKNANLILPKESWHSEAEITKEVLTEGLWQGEIIRVNKNHTEIIVESRWTLVTDEKGEPKSILIVDTDITHKKQLEKQLLRAQRMESIGTLASGIAHDLNNVLSPILMSAQFLRSKLRDENSTHMLSIVENNAKRGANLVKQVLLFARGMEGDRSVLNIQDLILEMRQIIEQTFPKSMQVEIVLAPDLWQICADHTQIHQVLMNLCLNARDAMHESGTITVSAENIFIDQNYAQMYLDARIGNYVMVTVEDNGIGIASECLDRIFEPFFTTKEFGKGTGLGLSTVMGIIKGHSGFITVSSTLGEGTKFQFYLPATDVESHNLVETNLTPKGIGESILVVDDEQAVREITKASLEDYNYQVITASDGIEALAAYAQNKDRVSAAIIDMMMPNMGGARTIQTLQRMNPEIKIIAVSGLATSEQIPTLDNCQKPIFLPKPYTAHELLKKLYEVIHC